MSDGPYRDEDPLAKINRDIVELRQRTDTLHEGALREVRGVYAHLRSSGRARSIAGWLAASFGVPATLAVFFYGLITAHASCEAENAVEMRGTVTNCRTQCTALGLHYGGFAHDSYGENRCVCGNGHGDGLFVGSDGHLHALRASAPQKRPVLSGIDECLTTCHHASHMVSYSPSTGICQCAQ